MAQVKNTKESQYHIFFDAVEKHGISQLGLLTNYTWNEDPKKVLITLSRYKFVAKMLDGKKDVLEIGCADAFGTRIVQQTVEKVTAIDFDPIFVEDVKARANPNWPIDCFVHDMLSSPIQGNFDAAYALDVLEHIHPDNEDIFISNIVNSLSENGVLIIGMPSLVSQVYASQVSKDGHINCKNGPDLKNFLGKYFINTFLFGMNDEVLHTGYSLMCHYLFVLAVGKK